MFRVFDIVPPLFVFFIERHRIELEKLPLMDKFDFATTLPSGSNRGKMSQSNGNRSFFTLESQIFFLIPYFSFGKCLDLDRSQHFAPYLIDFTKSDASLLHERPRSDFGTYKVVQAINVTNEFDELV